MARSRSGISAILASTSLSPSALPAFSSRVRSFIAARSSAVNPLDRLRVVLFVSAIAKHLRSSSVSPRALGHIVCSRNNFCEQLHVAQGPAGLARGGKPRVLGERDEQRVHDRLVE